MIGMFISSWRCVIEPEVERARESRRDTSLVCAKSPQDNSSAHIRARAPRGDKGTRKRSLRCSALLEPNGSPAHRSWHHMLAAALSAPLVSRHP